MKPVAQAVVARLQRRDTDAAGQPQFGAQFAHATRLGRVPVLGALLGGERWPFWLGLLFVLSVYFFPRGIVGQLRAWAAPRRVSAPAAGTATP